MMPDYTLAMQAVFEHELAGHYIRAWCQRLLAKRPRNWPWFTTFPTIWDHAHREDGACTYKWTEPDGAAERMGHACFACNGIFVFAARLRSRAAIYEVACHEVLHIAHPSWGERRTEEETERLCRETPPGFGERPANTLLSVLPACYDAVRRVPVVIDVGGNRWCAYCDAPEANGQFEHTEDCEFGLLRAALRNLGASASEAASSPR